MKSLLKSVFVLSLPFINKPRKPNSSACLKSANVANYWPFILSFAHYMTLYHLARQSYKERSGRKWSKKAKMGQKITKQIGYFKVLPCQQSFCVSWQLLITWVANKEHHQITRESKISCKRLLDFFKEKNGLKHDKNNHMCLKMMLTTSTESFYTFV